MLKTASVNIMLDPEIKKIAGLPFDLRPTHLNSETLEAMAEADRISIDPSVKGYRDVKAMFEELDADE